jgi:hypothetical protein
VAGLRFFPGSFRANLSRIPPAVDREIEMADLFEKLMHLMYFYEQELRGIASAIKPSGCRSTRLNKSKNVVFGAFLANYFT